MNTSNNRRGTKTSSFGTSGRTNHDSTAFYTSKLYESLPKEEKVEYVENPIPPESLNRILQKSSESMDDLPDNSVHLMVTSPPYNVGKDYDDDLTLENYREFLKRVWKEVFRVLVPGGRACINVANLGRKPYIPLHAFIVEDMIELGFLMRGEVIWDKASSAGSSTAWGSWQSASNPTLRDVHEYIMIFSKVDDVIDHPRSVPMHEYILIFSKNTFGRKNPLKRENTISRDEFLELTKSIWTFPSESARKIGHPAPFPVELPYRTIQLYTFEGEVVLDPFMGSGQTAIAAIKSKRHYIGYELDREYAKLADKRAKEFRLEFDSPKLSDFTDT
ncbi:site-specific DNA-methyltransferase [Methanosarcinales archaeon]|nr:MAG: site-specific DNA-methyltransferase [Methanosarcinales archaeon]